MKTHCFFDEMVCYIGEVVDAKSVEVGLSRDSSIQEITDEQGLLQDCLQIFLVCTQGLQQILHRLQFLLGQQKHKSIKLNGWIF